MNIPVRKSKEKKRLFLRIELKTHNLQLAYAAKDAGVIEPIDYAVCHDRSLCMVLFISKIQDKMILKINGNKSTVNSYN